MQRKVRSSICLLLGLWLLPVLVACNDTPSSVAPADTVNTTDAAPGGGAAETGSIPQISLQKVADGFNKPTFIGHAGDGSNRLFIVEQGGTIWIMRDGSMLQTPFLDISSRVTSGGERGLFVVVFPAGYGRGKNHFYVNYTSEKDDGGTRVSRFSITDNADVVDPASEEILLRVEQPFANHNGGQLAFGPDGYLYIGMGDGGSAGDPSENAQNPESLLGKMLRIEVESGRPGYGIPQNNPFAGRSGYRPEIWALGLRNPWRFSFDRNTGDLYIGDVGQNAFEEVDVQPASNAGGENYGWDIMEGFSCYEQDTCDKTGLTLPVLSYPLGNGNCAVTGGYVYRGREFPALQGVYIYGDYCSGRIWGLRKAGDAWENQLLMDSDLAISTFGQDQAGNLYAADHSGGGVYKIVVPASGG